MPGPPQPTPLEIDAEGVRMGSLAVPWSNVRELDVQGVEVNGRLGPVLLIALRDPGATKLGFVQRRIQRGVCRKASGAWDLALGAAGSSRPPLELLADARAALARHRG